MSRPPKPALTGDELELCREILSHGRRYGPGPEACARRITEERTKGIVTPKIIRRKSVSGRTVMRELHLHGLGKTPIQAKLQASLSPPGSWRNLLDACHTVNRASNAESPGETTGVHALGNSNQSANQEVANKPSKNRGRFLNGSLGELGKASASEVEKKQTEATA